MPEYESERVQREIEYRKYYEKEYEDDRRKPPNPNRRGNYGRARMSRELVEPGTAWPSTRSWRYGSRDTGQRSWKRWKRARKAATRGFQHEWIPPAKPKVPLRLLKDRQEDDLWYEEFYEGAQAGNNTD